MSNRLIGLRLRPLEVERARSRERGSDIADLEKKLISKREELGKLNQRLGQLNEEKKRILNQKIKLMGELDLLKISGNRSAIGNKESEIRDATNSICALNDAIITSENDYREKQREVAKLQASIK